MFNSRDSKRPGSNGRAATVSAATAPSPPVPCFPLQSGGFYAQDLPSHTSEVFADFFHQTGLSHSVPSPDSSWVDHYLADDMRDYAGTMAEWSAECDPMMLPFEAEPSSSQTGVLESSTPVSDGRVSDSLNTWVVLSSRSKIGFDALSNRASISEVDIPHVPGLCVHRALAILGVPTLDLPAYPSLFEIKKHLLGYQCALALEMNSVEYSQNPEPTPLTSVVVLKVDPNVRVGDFTAVMQLSKADALHRQASSLGVSVVAHVIGAKIRPTAASTTRVQHEQSGLHQRLEVSGSLFDLAAFSCMIGSLPPIPEYVRPIPPGLSFGVVTQRPPLTRQISPAHKYVDAEAAGYCVHRCLSGLGIDASDLVQYPSAKLVQEHLDKLGYDLSFTKTTSPQWVAALTRPLVTMQVTPTIDPMTLHAVSATLLRTAELTPGVIRVPASSTNREGLMDVVIGGDRIEEPTQQRSKVKAPRRAGSKTLEFVSNTKKAMPVLADGYDPASAQGKHAQKQLQALERKINALERNHFLASNFGASSFDPVELAKLELSGHNARPTGVPEAISTLEHVAANWQGHPKLFGPSDRTTVLRTTASRILPLTGISAGDRIYGFFLRSAPYKGAVICRRQPGAVSYDILGFVTPNRDPEKLGTSSSALWGGLKISALQNISGTVTSTATMQIERGHTKDFPVFIESGKMASVCVGQCPATEVVGTKSYDFMIFNGDWPLDQLTRKSGRDPINPALITTPNPGVEETAPTTGQYCVNAFRINASSNTGTAATVGGFSIGAGAVTLPASTLNQPIWQLANCTQYARHFLFGQFKFQLKLPRLSFSGTSSTFFLILKVTFGDLSTMSFQLNQSFAFGGPNVESGFYWEIDTRGEPAYLDTVGRGIKNMELLVSTTAGSNITIPANVGNVPQRPSIELTFHEVNTEEEYVGFILSGALPSGQVSVEIMGETELTIDNTAEIGSFIEPTPESPLFPVESMRQALQLVGVAAGNTDQRAFTASGFTRFLKKAAGAVGKFIKPIGSAVKTGLGMLGYPAAVAANPGAAAARAMQNMMENSQKSEYTPQPPTGYRSTSFGEGVLVKSMRTHMKYPAVRELDDGFDFMECHIVHGGSGSAPEFVRDLGLNLRSEEETFGRSSDLAFALAAARQLGLNVRDGLYTGQVDDFYMAGDDCCFVLSPVDDRDEKLTGASSIGGLSGLFLDGWYERNRKVQLGQFSFGTRVRADVEPIPATLGDNIPTTCYRITLRNAGTKLA